MERTISHILQAKQLLQVMSAQSVSTYANQVMSFVVPWLVLSRTGSAANAGMVAFAMGIAAFVGILTGGFVIDRVGGRVGSIIADSLSLLTALLLAVALFVDFFALWFVIITQIVGVFFDGPGQVAKNTLIPAAAKAEKVPVVRAMGLQQTLQNVAMFVGPLSAGLLVAVFSESLALLLATVLFGAAISLVFQFQRTHLGEGKPLTIQQVRDDTREAVRFLIHEPFLGPMQLFGPVFAFMIPISTLIFPAWFVLSGQDADALGIFLGAQAIGGIVGGFLFAIFGPKTSQHGWLVAATAAYAICLAGLSYLQPGSLPVVAVGFLTGTVFTGIMAIPFAAFYTRTPQKLLGRVNSLGAASGSIFGALAALFYGWLMQTTSPKTGLIACAAGMAMVALAALFLPFMRHLDEPPSAYEDTNALTAV